MKLAFTVNSKEKNPYLDRRFGRCAYFLIIDTETHKRECLPNPSADAYGGAGTQAAQFLAERDVGVVISGDFGPKAFTTLEAANIQMYSAQGGQVEALMDDFLAERLTHVTASTGPQRHGGRRSRGGRGR